MSQNQAPTTGWNGARPIPPRERKDVVRAKRRRFSASYKLRIVQEADECRRPGQIGELLRREGLYSSQLSDWRRERAAGQLQGMSEKKRGPKPDEQAAEMASLRCENERLKAQLSQAELIISAQKKLAQAFEQALTPEKDRP
jgi:transposase-like protein